MRTSILRKTKSVKVFLSQSDHTDKRRGKLWISTGNAEIKFGLREARTIQSTIKEFFKQRDINKTRKG